MEEIHHLILLFDLSFSRPRPTACSNLLAQSQRSSTLSSCSSRLPFAGRNYATSQVSTSPSSHIKPLLPPQTSTPSPADLPSDTPSAISIINRTSTASSGRWVLARLHSRNYLLHPTDILTVPLLKSQPTPGSLLSLNRILEVGTREHILRAPQTPRIKGEFVMQEEIKTLPNDLVRCNLTVLEHTKSPLEKTLKKKRRKGYKKTIQHKQGWTRLRVGDIHVGEASV